MSPKLALELRAAEHRHYAICRKIDMHEVSMRARRRGESEDLELRHNERINNHELELLQLSTKRV